MWKKHEGNCKVGIRKTDEGISVQNDIGKRVGIENNKLLERIVERGSTLENGHMVW